MATMGGGFLQVLSGMAGLGKFIKSIPVPVLWAFPTGTQLRSFGAFFSFVTTCITCVSLCLLPVPDVPCLRFSYCSRVPPRVCVCMSRCGLYVTLHSVMSFVLSSQARGQGHIDAFLPQHYLGSADRMGRCVCYLAGNSDQ